MRISFFCSNFLIRRGGAEYLVLRLAEELGTLGHEVTIVSAEGSLPVPAKAGYGVQSLPRAARCERWMGTVAALEKARGFHRLNQWVFPDGLHRKLARGPWCPELSRPEIYKKADVVVMVGHGDAWPLLAGKAMRKVKHALRVAMPLLHPREYQGNLKALRERYAPYDLVIGLTGYERAWMERQGWGGQRIGVIPAGSDDGPHEITPGSFRSQTGIPPDAPMLLFLGRKYYNKGLTHLIQAMDEVWQKHPEARLVLMGFSHNPACWIEGAIAGLDQDARGRIINLDDVSDEQREKALEDCDALALPSIAESFGIVLLDAWRHAKPVIGCRDTCAESIIAEGKDGLLVNFGDSRGLAGAINDLIGNRERSVEMGRAGFDKWKACYRWDVIAREFDELVRERAGLNARS